MPIEKIVWEDKFKLGIRVIDEQHEQLFYLINRLGDEIETGITEEILDATLNELRDYCVYHFATEESIVKKKSERKWRVHEEIHNSFEKILNFFIFRVQEEPPEKLSVQIHSFLKDWLQKHVLKVDFFDLKQ